MKKLTYQLIGTLLLIAALTLAIIFFSWKLALIIFLALTGNNIERHFKK